MEFEIKRIRDFCDVSSSKCIYAEQYVEEGIPFYRSKEIIEKNDNKEISEPLFISQEVYENIKRKFGVPKAGDLLLTSVGTLGIPYLVKDEIFYFKDGNLTWFKNFRDHFNSGYLYYWFSSKFGHDDLVSRAIGSSQGAITIDMLKKHKILVPSYQNQDRIVQLMKNYDSLLEKNNKQILLLERMAESIYKEWFVRFRFPGCKNHLFSDGIPDGWKYKKFSNICSFVRGLSYSSEQIENPDAPNLLINLKNIRDYGGFRKENFKKYDGDYKKEQTVNKFDLVMAVTEMVQERRIIGYVGLVPTYDQNCIISADLIKLVSNFNNIYLYSLLTFGGVSLCFSQYGNGTNVIHLKPTSLRNVKILIPEKDLIDKYVKTVNSYFELIDKLQLENEILIKERDSLLPRLMSGKLSVEGKEIV